MSGTVSMWAREAIVRHIFRGETTLLTTCYVALTLAVPESNAPGSNLVEPGAGYARVQVPFGTANWELTGYGEVTNAADVVFPNPTANWGLMQGYALVNALTGGETIAVGSLVNPQRVDFSKPPIVRAGGIIFGLFD